jgi:sugar lactone lactonase YvrE
MQRTPPTVGALLAASCFAVSLGCSDAGSATPAAPADSSVTADGAVTDAPATPDAPAAPPTIPALGNGMHTPASVRVTVVASDADELDRPRDLAFNPEAPEQLWILNNGSSSITIVRNAGTPERDSVRNVGRGNTHFMARPSALAFGAPGIFATSQETDEVTERGAPPDFMGPTLWDSNYDLFDSGDDSHIDMLHNSPNAVGIAWEVDNVYWVVDGAHRCLTRYDFQEPHPRSGTDHRSANVRRYANGMLTYTENVSAHAVFDATQGRLYVSEPGANRVAMFDPSAAEMGARILPNYDGSQQRMMGGGTLETFIDGAANELRKPSGLALVGDTFYVTDNETSRVVAFDRMGRRVDWLDLSSEVQTGGLMGIAVDARGWIYLTDAIGNRVIEVAPR